MADEWSDIPDFDSLPPVEGMPKGCAWGVFDKNGKKDRLGCLNLLTPKVVQAALREARDGDSVSLNWPLGALAKPSFGRKGLIHKVIAFTDTPLNLHGFDDELEFNTQCSSQWDSLVHFSHQPSQSSYNGTKAEASTLIQAFGETDKHKDLPTLNHWHDRGGLVGRGVLLDYKAYADAKGITYDCFDAHTITIKDLEDVAAWEGVEMRQGDICLVRSGFTDALGAMDAEGQGKALDTHRTCGVEGSVAVAKWFWNHHFAAVAGDAIAFERTPPVKEDGTEGGIGELVLHQWFLALFGLNIGELWDLKALGETCARKKRYSFLLTSCPLNVSGGVGSPPNALAIF